VDGTPYTGDLDLDAVHTRDDLIALLKIVHIRADKPSLRTLEARTRHSATPLSKTAVAEMLKGLRFPRKATMVSFLHACGVPDDRMDSWQRAWERVATGEGMASSRAAQAAHSLGHVFPIEPRNDGTPAQSDPTVDAATVRRLEDENKRLRAQLTATREQVSDPPQPGESASYRRPLSPVVSQRELGARLHTLREENRLTVEQVASYLMCSPEKVRRMEGNFRSGTVRDVRDLCSLYRVTEPAERDRLMELAREAKQQGWWQPYNLEYADYVGLEAAATASKNFNPLIVPGILQTADYARELHVKVVPALGQELIEQGVETRLIRQRRLSETNPLRVWSILDEAVLHRVVGGPGVMRAQLERLKEAASLPNVTVQVIPFEAGAHAATESNFTILELGGPVGSVIFAEGLTGFIYLDSLKDIERYELIFEGLTDAACSEDESIRKIIDMSEALR